MDFFPTARRGVDGEGLLCLSTFVYSFKNPPTKSLKYLSKGLCIAKRNFEILGKNQMPSPRFEKSSEI